MMTTKFFKLSRGDIFSMMATSRGNIFTAVVYHPNGDL